MKRPIAACAAAAMYSMLLGGCASTAPVSEYSNATSAFNSSVTAATAILQKSLSDQTHVQRVTAIEYYLDDNEKSPLTLNSNINHQNQDESFARFACAGTNTVPGQADLKTLSDYGAQLDAATKAPAGDVASLWNNIIQLRSAPKPLTTIADPTADQFQKCRTSVTSILNIAPSPLQVETGDARFALSAAISTLQAGVSALESLAASILQIVDDEARKKQFTAIVKADKDEISRLLNDPALNAALEKQQEQRLLASLSPAHERFAKMLKLPKTDRVAVYDEAAKVEAELGTWDELRLSPPPSNIMAAISNCQQKLLDLADGKVTAKDTAAYIQGLAKEIQAVQDAFSGAKSKIDAVRQL